MRLSDLRGLSVRLLHPTNTKSQLKHSSWQKSMQKIVLQEIVRGVYVYTDNLHQHKSGTSRPLTSST